MKLAIIVALIAALIVVLLPITQLPSAPAPDPSPSPTHEIILSVQSGTTVETVELEQHLIGVVAGEMPALFEPEALKAQAVAARTYILHRMSRTVAAHPAANICNNPACCKAYCSTETMQANWGEHFDAYYAKIAEAVRATNGIYLSYHDQPIEAVFHSSSAGATESSGAIWNDRPYLVSVDSPETDADVPNYITKTTFTSSELKSALTAYAPQLSFTDAPATWITDLQKNDSGRVDSAAVCGTVFTGAQLRSALSLRSAAFDLQYADDVFTFTVTGYGHGVGMSQYGANVFAKQGLSYREILAHYYPETQLSSTAG